MIYTVTFNPAIDYLMWAENPTLGRTNRSLKEKLFIGGKGINVSRILNTLDVPTTAMGFLGGFTGKEIENFLKKQGVNTDFIWLENRNSRINVKLKGNAETEINGVGPKILDEEIALLISKLSTINEGDTLVLAGSIPNSLPKNIYEIILNTLKGKNIRLVVDAEGELLTNCLKFNPFLIKPNKDELSALFGKELKTDEEIILCAKELQSKGAENVLVSLGKDGAILITKEEVYKAKAKRGKTINSVGAGDSMVAGFLAGYFKTKDFSLALELGIASGSATAFCEDLAEKEEILSLFGQSF